MIFLPPKQLCLRFLFYFVFIIFFHHFHTSFSLAQNSPRVTISGQVIDAETRQPLPNVDVYLLGTTLGDMADENGNYIIERIPYGNYELVASMIGYEIQKKKIAIYPSTLRTFDFRLKSKIIKGEKIEITAEQPGEWKKNLTILEEVFFGVKEFSKNCKFINPEYINIEYNEDLKEFKAFAEEPIRFENKALGYEVTFELKEFFMKLDDREEATIDKSRFQRKKRTCVVQFYKERTPKNNGEKKKWKKNRLKAYHGSQRHFLKSLYANRLKKEGFEIYGSSTVTKMDDFQNLHRIKLETLLKKGENNGQKKFSIPEYLMVMYKKEKNDVEYERLYNRHIQHPIWSQGSVNAERVIVREGQDIEKDTKYQISWLSTLKGQDVIINENGFIVIENSDLNLVTGYWIWDCPAEWLPYDYDPDEK